MFGLPLTLNSFACSLHSPCSALQRVALSRFRCQRSVRRVVVYTIYSLRSIIHCAMHAHTHTHDRAHHGLRTLVYNFGWIAASTITAHTTNERPLNAVFIFMFDYAHIVHWHIAMREENASMRYSRTRIGGPRQGVAAMQIVRVERCPCTHT